MKTIISTSADTLKKLAKHIALSLEKKPDAVLAVSCEPVMEQLFEELTELYKKGGISFKAATIFAVSEFESDGSRLSCKQWLKSSFLDMVDADIENCHFLAADALDSYDAAISAAGGIDLALMSIGQNASIGFNEPATLFDTYTHRQKLTNATKRHYAARFGGEDRVPDFGMTIGIKTIVSARETALLVLGEDFAEAVFKMVYSKTITYVPASFLQMPLEVTVYLDEAAAKKL